MRSKLNPPGPRGLPHLPQDLVIHQNFTEVGQPKKARKNIGDFAGFLQESIQNEHFVENYAPRKSNLEFHALVVGGDIQLFKEVIGQFLY
jgi:hypothetical protein